MLEQNKKIARKFMEEVWSEGKLGALDQIVSTDCRLHDPVFPSLTSGRDNLKTHIQMCRNAFPDLRFTVDDEIAERNEVVLHWTARGTHKAPFLGMAPTERKATVSGTSIYRFQGDKIAETWSDWNVMTLMEQLGLSVKSKAEALR
jgi:steroid delta-isomerase-like uncharacterized protein